MAELNIDIDIPKIIAPVLAKQVIPKLGELRKAGIFNTFKEIKNDYVEHVFKEYFLRRYADLITIDTLVLQNQQVPFDNLYFPLTVITHDNKEEVNIKIDGYPKDFLGKYFKVLIEDTAGMGKSTILRKLFLSVIEEHCAIPILIELRNLNADHGVMDEIIHQLTPIGEKLDQEFLLHLIKRGDFVFLFDGYDEIPLDNRQKVSLDLHDFISKTGENLFVLSSRPEDELASFGQFRKFTIRPLEKEESYEVIDIYARCDQRDFSQDLVKLLELPENRSVHEFLTNPLLTSLLYASFDYNREIPLEKAQFYRSVFDGLFNRHDISKKGYYKREKKCGLHKDNFESILRGIGFFTMKMGKVRYDKDEILGVIDKSRRFFELQFSPSDFLEDLLKAVPIFQRDGTFIRWSHKSLQDYFAARFLCLDTGEKQERELSKLILNPNAEKRQNVIELVYYLNQKAFRRFVLSPFLELIFEFVENEMSYAEMEHSEDSVKFKEATLALHLSIREKTSILEHCIVVFDKISEEDPESDFDTYLITHSFNEFDKQQVLSFGPRDLVCNKSISKLKACTITFRSQPQINSNGQVKPVVQETNYFHFLFFVKNFFPKIVSQTFSTRNNTVSSDFFKSFSSHCKTHITNNTKYIIFYTQQINNNFLFEDQIVLQKLISGFSFNFSACRELYNEIQAAKKREDEEEYF